MLNAEDLKGRLALLREVLPTEDDAPYGQTFDEFIREHEFGLALTTICDFLTLERPELITSSRIAVVKELQESMHIADDCAAQLKSSAQLIERSPE